MKIKAAVARAANKSFSLESVNLDAPREDEILVRLVATGVCHTDISVVEQLLPIALPVVLGHEGSGTVEQIGAKVKHLKVGDSVVLTYAHCGHCKNCSSGHSAYCDHYGAMNFSGMRGDGSRTLHDAAGAALGGSFLGQSSFATYALSPAVNAVKVRSDAPLEQLGPLACGFSTGAGAVLNVLKPSSEASLAVLGAGAVGLAAIMAAKTIGCHRILAVDRYPTRLELALSLGATDVLDTSGASWADELAASGPVDYVIDTTGVPKLVEAAIGALRLRGTCILLGASRDSDLHVNIMHMIGGRTVTGVIHGDPDQQTFIPQLIDLFMEGKFPIDRLSQFYSLEQINEAVADSKCGKTIKPILRL